MTSNGDGPNGHGPVHPPNGNGKSALYDGALERRVVSALSLSPEAMWPALSHLRLDDLGDVDARCAWAKLSEALRDGRAVDPADFTAFHDPFQPPLILDAWAREAAGRIADLALHRRALAAASEIAKAAFAHDTDRVRTLLFRAPDLAHGGGRATLRPASEAASEAWDLYATPGAANAGIRPLGLVAVDRAMGGGAEPGTLTVIMARPSMGKTSVLVQISDAASLTGVVAVFSKEMTQAQWQARLAARRARVSLLAAKQGTLSSEDHARFLDEIIAVGKRANLVIDDATPQTTDDLYDLCLEAKREHGRLDFVLADHLRLFADKADNETHRLGAIAWGLKRLARELATRVVVAAQLSRAVEAQSDRRPDLKDLRDSGEIEETADTVIALYRPKYYDPHANNVAEFWIRKDRNGERGAKAEMVFVDHCMSFESITRQ